MNEDTIQAATIQAIGQAATAYLTSRLQRGLPWEPERAAALWCRFFEAAMDHGADDGGDASHGDAWCSRCDLPMPDAADDTCPACSGPLR